MVFIKSPTLHIFSWQRRQWNKPAAATTQLHWCTLSERHSASYSCKLYIAFHWWRISMIFTLEGANNLLRRSKWTEDGPSGLVYGRATPTPLKERQFPFQVAREMHCYPRRPPSTSKRASSTNRKTDTDFGSGGWSNAMEPDHSTPFLVQQHWASPWPLLFYFSFSWIHPQKTQKTQLTTLAFLIMRRIRHFSRHPLLHIRKGKRNRKHGRG